MKAFSKEWWKDKVVLCSQRMTSLLKSGKVNEAARVGRIRNYCFKRYSEAYHREKMVKTFWSTWDLAGSEATQIEQERILGIIEEMVEKYTGWDYNQAEVLKEVIEKIKR